MVYPRTPIRVRLRKQNPADALRGKAAYRTVATEIYAAVRQYSTETDAYAAIADFTAVAEVDLSEDFIRRLAREEPAMPRASDRGRIVVFSDEAGVATARMFQSFGESTRPLFHVVHTLDEALEAIGVESSDSELLP